MMKIWSRYSKQELSRKLTIKIAKSRSMMLKTVNLFTLSMIVFTRR